MECLGQDLASLWEEGKWRDQGHSLVLTGSNTFENLVQTADTLLTQGHPGIWILSTLQAIPMGFTEFCLKIPTADEIIVLLSPGVYKTAQAHTNLGQCHEDFNNITAG